MGKLGEALKGGVIGGVTGFFTGGPAGAVIGAGLGAYGGYQSAEQAAKAAEAAGDSRAAAEIRQRQLQGRIGEVRSQFGIEDENITNRIGEIQARLKQIGGMEERLRLGPAGAGMSSQVVVPGGVNFGVGDDDGGQVVVPGGGKFGVGGGGGGMGLMGAMLKKSIAERPGLEAELQRLQGISGAAGKNRKRLSGLLDSQQRLVADSADRSVLGGFQAGTTQSRQRLASRGLLGGSAAGQVRENLLTDMIAGREFAGEQGRAARSEAENALTSLRLRLEDQARGSGEAIPGAAESLRQQGSVISQAASNIGANTLGNLFKVGGSVYELDQTARGQGFSGLPSFNSLPANTRSRDRLSLTEVGR